MKLNQQHIKTLAQRAGYGSLADLARCMGVSRSTLTRRFNGQSWTFEQVLALAKLLRVETTEILCDVTK